MSLPLKNQINGLEFMGENIKPLLKKCGKNVKIHPLVKIVNPGAVEIGDNAIIDDYTFIAGGQGVIIGRNTHIASFVTIIGGGLFELGDFGGISAGCRIVTGSDDFSGLSLTNPSIPAKYKPNLKRGYVKIGKHAVLGTNTIVHQDVTIGTGAVTGSGSLVTHDLEPWTIYVGIPTRKFKKRSKELLKFEKEYLKEQEI